jgi:hypothetical protein
MINMACLLQKKISGNIGDRELYRYTAPSQKEVEEKVEGLF